MSPATTLGPRSTLGIDRLTLHAPWLSESEARRLAGLVGAALGRSTLPPLVHGSSPSVAVEVEARSGEPTEQLATRIATAILARATDQLRLS
jgi:hypothetical protein